MDKKNPTKMDTSEKEKRECNKVRKRIQIIQGKRKRNNPRTLETKNPPRGQTDVQEDIRREEKTLPMGKKES